jgi:hypothetical protein
MELNIAPVTELWDEIYFLFMFYTIRSKQIVKLGGMTFIFLTKKYFVPFAKRK